MNGARGSWAGQVRSPGNRGLGLVGGVPDGGGCIQAWGWAPGYSAPLQAGGEKSLAGGQVGGRQCSW